MATTEKKKKLTKKEISLNCKNAARILDIFAKGSNIDSLKDEIYGLVHNKVMELVGEVEKRFDNGIGDENDEKRWFDDDVRQNAIDEIYERLACWIRDEEYQAEAELVAYDVDVTYKDGRIEEETLSGFIDEKDMWEYFDENHDMNEIEDMAITDEWIVSDEYKLD